MSGACRSSSPSRWCGPRTPSSFGARLASAVPAFVCSAALVAPAAAHAQASRFNVPAQRLAEGVLALGRQAGVSIGVRDATGCAAFGRAVRGRLTVEQALGRLLGGSGCAFRRVDARTYVVAAEQPRTSGPGAAAAPAPPDPPDLLDSIVVSTARRDALVGRTPYAISVISGADLTADGIAGSQGVAAQLAELTETNLGAGRDKLFIRGISDGAFTGRTQATVGLYLDDVPITYSAPNPDLLLTDVDRVEVLRGPQGSLYGVGSIGGVMRIVTRRPDLSGFHASASAMATTTAGGASGGTITAMANVPLVRDRFAVRAVAYSEVMGGYLNNAGLGLANVNRATRDGLRLAAAAQLAPEWRFTAGFTQQYLDAADGQSVVAGGGAERGRALLEPHDNDFRQVNATLEGKGGWGGLKLSAGYVRHDFSTRYDATPAAAQFGLPPGPTAYDEENRVEFTVAEAVVTTPEDRRLHGLFGVFAARAEQRTTYGVSQVAPAYLEARKDALHEAALFGEANYGLTDRLKLTVGARIFGASLHTASTNRPDGAVPGGRLKKADLATKVVLAFQARPDLLVYVQAAEGYRLGGFNTSGLVSPSRAGGAQPALAYRADELWSYEIGAKAALFDGRLQVQAAAFYAVWRDVQSDQFMVSGLPYTANVGDADNPGVEVEASFRLDSHLVIRTNLLVNGPEVVRPDPTFVGREEAGLPAVPKVSAVGAVDYRRPVGSGLTLSAHAQVEYIGRSRLSFGPIAGPSMGDYLTNRVSLQLGSNRWRVQAFVENIANTREDTFSFGNPFSGAQAYATPLRPRTVGLSVSADF